jgi:hypothetical protein
LALRVQRIGAVRKIQREIRLWRLLRSSGIRFAASHHENYKRENRDISYKSTFHDNHPIEVA